MVVPVLRWNIFPYCFPDRVLLPISGEIVRRMLYTLHNNKENLVCDQ